MKIAILGWGSLIWKPGNLEIKKDEDGNFWNKDGPMLPVEFGRISKDGRLTLVIVPGEKKVQTLYAISNFEELDHAVLDLAVREGCGRDKIGSYNKIEDKFFPSDFKCGKCKDEVKKWVNEKEDVDTVIWTNLSEKYWYYNIKKERIEVDKTKIVQYLENLPSNKKALAEQYVRRTPVTIDTKIREEIENKLEWYKIVCKWLK